MSSPTVGVLALQGDVREHVAALSRLGAPVRLVRLPDDLAAVDALVLPGGESTTMSRLLRVSGLMDPLRERLAAGLPCLATCAGAIMLSSEIVDGRPDQVALGVLPISVRRNGYGRQVESFEVDLAIPAIGDVPFPGVFIRAPVFESVGPGAEVLAEHEGSSVAVAVGDHLAMGFHPEMTRDDRIHALFLRRVAGRVAARR